MLGNDPHQFDRIPVSEPESLGDSEEPSIESIAFISDRIANHSPRIANVNNDESDPGDDIDDEKRYPKRH